MLSDVSDVFPADVWPSFLREFWDLGVYALLSVLWITTAALSLWWTTRNARSFLGHAVGRKLRHDEETSIRTWLTLSGSDLDKATRELQPNLLASFLAGQTLPRVPAPDDSIDDTHHDSVDWDDSLDCDD
jgi:hypothetical protein